MAEPSLNASLFSRLTMLLRPDWTRTVLARRIAAGGLVLLAGVAALRSNTDADGSKVVVAARDLRPGSALTYNDIRLETRSAATLPDGSQTDLGAVVGSTLAARRDAARCSPMCGSWAADWPSRRPVPAPASSRSIWPIAR
ncbi:SAF-like family protein [Mycobacterium kansasii]|uniref:SAF-like family protein n=1 Tax=Mycobacterium kansasii TaxID=1768 RepID=A0A1V3XJL9_MYCKA|nr:SAF-like family protein [Mycobacterium kansasii]